MESNRLKMWPRLLHLLIVMMLGACQTILPGVVESTPDITSNAPTPATATSAAPVGKLLFVSTQSGNSEIYLSNPDGTDVVNLTNNPTEDVNPVWSPDGQSIAFQSIRAGQEQIYIMRADGSQVTPVPNTGPLDIPVGWSPDGRYLVLTSYRTVDSDLFAIKTDGSSLLNLSRAPGDDYGASWSPDGSKIAFDSDRDSQADNRVRQVYVMDVDGANTIRLTDFPNGVCCPVWSPDGLHIAFSVVGSTPDRVDVYLMDADGGNVRRLTNLPGLNVVQSWSPDGKEFIVSQVKNDVAQSYLVTVEDGVSREIPIRSSHLRWEPEGKLAAEVPMATPIPEPASPSTFALINGILIDGTGREPIQDAALLIQNGRILAVGRRTEVDIPAESVIIDVQGGTILPGFIDAHVHGATNHKNLYGWAQAGVTTVCSLAENVGGLYRDWNAWVELAEDERTPPFLFAFRDATLNHPQYARLVAAGPIVSVADGYPRDYWGPGIDLAVTSPEDAHLKVSRLVEAGADIVKISLESGPRLSVEEVQAIVDVAHEHGTLVTAHVATTPFLAEGVAGGIDVAAHMATDRWADELLAEMVAHEIYLVPTLSVYSRACGQPGDCLDNLRRFVDAGGKVALGNDYGNPGAEVGMPVREIELMQLAGMTPMQIIVAATQNAAHACNQSADLGTLEAGKIADVLVVDSDPLIDIHALTDVKFVIHYGVIN